MRAAPACRQGLFAQRLAAGAPGARSRPSAPQPSLADVASHSHAAAAPAAATLPRELRRAGAPVVAQSMGSGLPAGMHLGWMLPLPSGLGTPHAPWAYSHLSAPEGSCPLWAASRTLPACPRCPLCLHPPAAHPACMPTLPSTPRRAELLSSSGKQNHDCILGRACPDPGPGCCSWEGGFGSRAERGAPICPLFCTIPRLDERVTVHSAPWLQGCPSRALPGPAVGRWSKYLLLPLLLR